MFPTVDAGTSSFRMCHVMINCLVLNQLDFVVFLHHSNIKELIKSGMTNYKR